MPTTKREPTGVELDRRQTGWQATRELLKAGQYEQVAEVLHEAQAASERAGDVILADTLAAARQICLAGSQCQAEAAWHQQACKEADQREHELRQQVYSILNLIGGREATETREEQVVPLLIPTARFNPPERDIPASMGQPNLVQRIRSLLGWRAASQSTAWESPTKSGQAPDAPFALTVYCLGPFRTYNNEQLIEKWPGQKCKSIFKYMIIHRKRPIHQEILMDLFWRDADPASARRNLYQAIYSLRQALHNDGPDFPYILCEESCYHLNPDIGLWVDSEAFASHYQTGQRLEREGHLHKAVEAYALAENLYEGEFLLEDRYEDWTLIHREDLKYMHLDILARLSQYYFDQAQFAMCIAFCQKILAQDNCREDAHRRLMRCYLHQGQRHLALRQYHLCAEALKRELNVPPMPATIELYQKNCVQFPDA
jgi:DNA-binding SARP family transcriptional activator